MGVTGGPLCELGEELQGHEAQSPTPWGQCRDRTVDDWTQAFPREDAGTTCRTGLSETASQLKVANGLLLSPDGGREESGVVEADSRDCGRNGSRVSRTRLWGHLEPSFSF